jgi:hypothetical protein
MFNFIKLNKFNKKLKIFIKVEVVILFSILCHRVSNSSRKNFSDYNVSLKVSREKK